jgi:hypothetical protein
VSKIAEINIYRPNLDDVSCHVRKLLSTMYVRRASLREGFLGHRYTLKAPVKTFVVGGGGGGGSDGCFT